MQLSLDHFFQSSLFYEEVKKIIMRSHWLTNHLHLTQSTRSLDQQEFIIRVRNN